MVSYFAYGSNLDPEQMRSRCPDGAFRTVARLPDHALAFTRFAPRRGCGVADVVERPGADVWGVVYDLNERDLARLDAFEGYAADRTSNAYRRVRKRVVPAAADARPVDVVTYEVCDRQPGHVPPDMRYLAHLLRGAEAWGLPPAYVEALHRVPLA